MKPCKIVIGLCVIILLVLIFLIVPNQTKTEGLINDGPASNIPSCFAPDRNPEAGFDVHNTYLAERGWNRGSGRVEGMCGARPVEGMCGAGPYDSRDKWSENNPIKGGDMKSAPNEISTVNNGVAAANGSDNTESFSSEELMSSLKGRNNMWGAHEAPSFWEANPELTASGFYHNVNQGTSNKDATNVLATQEKFTSEQLLKSAGGGNASNY